MCVDPTSWGAAPLIVLYWNRTGVFWRDKSWRTYYPSWFDESLPPTGPNVEYAGQAWLECIRPFLKITLGVRFTVICIYCDMWASFFLSRNFVDEPFSARHARVSIPESRRQEKKRNVVHSYVCMCMYVYACVCMCLYVRLSRYVCRIWPLPEWMDLLWDRPTGLVHIRLVWQVPTLVSRFYRRSCLHNPYT